MSDDPCVHRCPSLQKTLTVTPLLTTKTLPLVLKAATTMPPAAAMPVMPAAAAGPGQCPPTLAMVTTALGGVPAKPMANSDSPVTATPINLQLAAGKLTSQNSDHLRIIAKNAIVVSAAKFFWLHLTLWSSQHALCLIGTKSGKRLDLLRPIMMHHKLSC